MSAALLDLARWMRELEADRRGIPTTNVVDDRLLWHEVLAQTASP